VLLDQEKPGFSKNARLLTEELYKRISMTNTNNGFKHTLWAAADKLRGHLDAAEYKHVVLGLIFLKYISDAFQALHDDLSARAGSDYTDPEDRDEYLAENVFWVPPEARWAALQSQAKSPEIGLRLDEAMAAIERENPRLKGTLPQNYGRPALDKRRLGELIDLISTITMLSGDVLGQVYEYFLGQFASAEGKKGGEFYTPQSIVKLLVAMLEPYKGRVYDPCCGSGGMFVQSERFVAAHGGRMGDIAVYGQESNPTTWKLCRMNLAIHHIDGNIGPHAADTFHNDLHPDLKADYILANPPFNISDWGGDLLAEDKRWQYGVPPTGNANYAWLQHMLHHLAANGRAGIVLANGSMSSQQSGEGEIRRRLVEADLVACMVALPPQLFFNTQIPACLWFLSRTKPDGRQGQTLFIDARSLGRMVDRTRRELPDEEIERIAAVFHAWRVEQFAELPYKDEPGFCKSATLAEIAAHDYVLTPGRYVGAADVEDDGEPFEEKMERLVATLEEQLNSSAQLETTIRKNLRRLGW
jgi:type I restriction enzyme M protein